MSARIFVVACLFLASVALNAAPSAKNTNGKCVLSNDLVSVVINTLSGGRVESLVLKESKLDITAHPSSAANAPAGSGIGYERFVGTGGPVRNFETSEYKVKKCSADALEAAAELECELSGLRYTKTYILKEGRTSLEIHYQFANMRNTNICGQLWMGSSIIASDSGKEMKAYYPFGLYTVNLTAMHGKPQVTSLTFPRKDRDALKYSSNNAILFPADGWAAVVSDLGNGAAIDFDYPNLDRFYSYMPKPGDSGEMTTETFSTKFELMPLQKGIEGAMEHPELSDPLSEYVYKFRQTVTPLAGIKIIGGFNNGIAANMELKDGKADLIVEADRTLMGVTAKLTVFSPDGKSLCESESGTFDLLPAVLQKISMTAVSSDNFIATLELCDKSNYSAAKIRIVKLSDEAATGASIQAAAKKDLKFSPKMEQLDFNRNFADAAMPWGKNISRKIETIALFPMTAHREVAELERRLNCRVSPVEIHPYGLNTGRSSGQTWEIPPPEELLPKRLEKKADVIIIAGAVSWKGLPQKLQESMLEKVRAGTGLVYFTSGISPEFSALVQGAGASYPESGIPFKRLPSMGKYSSISDFVKCGFIGKGRVVMITYAQGSPLGHIGPRGILPYISEDDFSYKFKYWEYFLSLAARAVRYASGDELDAVISSSTGSELVINSKKNNDNAVLEIEVYDKNGVMEWKGEESAKLTPGENKISYKVPDKALRSAGFHIINFTLKSGKDTLDWFSSDFEKNDCARIQALNLNSLSFGDAGSPVSGFCETSGDGKLTLVLKDSCSRILACESLAAKAGKNNFAFNNYIHPLNELCFLEASLESEGRTDTAAAFFTLKTIPDNDVKFIIWNGGESTNWTGRDFLSRLKEIGYTSYIGSGNVKKTNRVAAHVFARRIMQSGLEFLPLGIHQVSARASASGGQKKERTPCLRSPEYRTAVEIDYSKAVEFYKEFYVRYYYMGDENSLGRYGSPHDYCTSKYCMSQFLEELKKKYTSLENLNKAWKTSFNGWEEVFPSTLAEAKESGVWGSWLEHRTFMFGALSEAFGIHRETLKKMVPYAGLGLSGMGEPEIHNGFDWEKLQDNIDLSTCYMRGADDVMDSVRSFAKSSSSVGMYSGYSGWTTPEVIIWEYWHQIANRCFSPGFYAAQYFTSHGDDSPSSLCKPISGAIRDIRASGIGKLIMEASWANSEVGALYSTPSLLATARSGTGGGILSNNIYNNNARGWSGLLRDCGLQPPQYFVPEQIEEGKLDPAKTPVFVLMLAQAMTDKTLNALEGYVEKGGILVADALPGHWDVNGVERSQDRLSNFFGCRYSLADFGKSSVQFSMDGTPLPIKPANDNIVLTGGTPLAEARKQNADIKFGSIEISSSPDKSGSVPGMIITRHGKGAVVYLNTSFENYQLGRFRESNSGPVRDALLAALKKAGLQLPGFKLPSGCELVRHKLGDITVFVMTRIIGADRNDSSKFTLPLPENSAVYDIRLKKAAFAQKVITGEILPGDAKVFAVAPAPLKDFSLNAEMRDGKIVFSIASDERQPLVYRYEILDKSGNPVSYYSRNIRVDGHWKGIIQTGIGEFPDAVSIRVTDVVTAKSREMRLK